MYFEIANTCTRASSSGSLSCCSDISLRNSLKETEKLVLSTDTVEARSLAWSSKRKKFKYFCY